MLLKTSALKAYYKKYIFACIYVESSRKYNEAKYEEAQQQKIASMSRFYRIQSIEST